MSNLRFSKAAADNMALLLASDIKAREIAQSYRCHAATVYWIKKNVDLFGEARPAPLAVTSRPWKITVEALEGLLNWVLNNRDDKKLLYINKMIHFLNKEYDIVNNWIDELARFSPAILQDSRAYLSVDSSYS
jgi:hypothetical protein